MNLRLTKLRELLKKENMDALLVSSLSNITYFSDFSGFTTEDRDAYLLITKKSQYIFTHPIYKEVAEQDFKNFTLIEYKRENPFSQAIKTIIEKENLAKVGIEAFDLTVQDYENLTKKLNKNPFINVDLITNLRMIKDSVEIQKIEKACQLGDKVFSHVLKKINDGITEKELAMEIEFFIKRNNANISFDPIVAFGPNASQPHHIPNETKLKKNQFILFDFGVKLDNYCSDMTRTIFFGNANEKQSKIYYTVLNAQNASIDYLKKKLSEHESIFAPTIDQAGRDYLSEQGYDPFNHASHGIGLNVHESPHLYPSSQDYMANGMVFSIEPGTYFPGKYGIRIEDIFTIENDQLIQLTKSKRELIELPISS